ncbi:MAG: ribonuclease III domain-containing protein [Candidatus Hodarchaeota archaeon]
MDNTSGLQWEPIGIEEKLLLLVEAVKDTERNTPSQNTRMLRKTKRWKEQLNEILDSLSQIRNVLGPRLEGKFQVQLSSKELLQVAMFQPSTKNLFSELAVHYMKADSSPLNETDFASLLSLSEMAKALALVGDAAIDMAVLHHIWQPRATDVGTLTERRANLVSNEHLANICDDWGMYDLRIHFDPATPSKGEIEHDKGTLIEAIYGILYIEHGFKKVKELVPLITQID